MTEKLMEFIELTEREQCYFHVKHILNPNGGAEIMFKNKTWKARKLTSPYGQDGDWVEFEQKNIFQFMNGKSLSITDFEDNLTDKILTRAVYSDMILQNAVNLLGSEMVSKAKDEWTAFGKELVGTITQITDKKKEK